MMRHLRSRRTSAALMTEPRRRRLTVIRFVYFVSLFALLVWIIDFLFGDLFYLRADGLVLGEPAAVASEFPGTVREVAVREGDHVIAGQVVAIMSSESVADTHARLTSDIATRRTRLDELRNRKELIEAMLSLAEYRQAVATSTRQEFETLLSRGFLSLDKRVAAIEGEYRSRQDAETLKAERRTIEAEAARLESAVIDSETAIRTLERAYDDGRLRAPNSGTVTRVAGGKGFVLRAGDPLIELLGDERYVLAYVPTGVFYSIEIGDEVVIATGLGTVRGIIRRIEPYAAALPREFQRTFRPVERQQVMRIEFLDGEPPLPLLAKVRVYSAWFARGWRSNLSHLFGMPIAAW